MDENLDDQNRLRNSNKLKYAYDNFAAGVGYIAVTLANGNESIGSCFHIGEGIFITAKHVVENCTIKEIGTTTYQRAYYELQDSRTTGMVRANLEYTPQATAVFKGPFLHPDENIDVAAILVPDIKAPALILGDHLDDWLGDEYVLSDVLVMGYPPIPFSPKPLLISAKCEVNTIVDKYTGGHPHFILSTMVRGGFSGGPVITEQGIVLGLVTESLGVNNQPTELGYLSVMSVEGIYNCIAHHKLIPKFIDEQWDGFWSKVETWYQNSESEHIVVTLYDRPENANVSISSFRADILDIVKKMVMDLFQNSFVFEQVHDMFFRFHYAFKQDDTIKPVDLYVMINDIVAKFDIPIL